MPGGGNKGATAIFSGTERVHRARLYALLKSIWIEMMTEGALEPRLLLIPVCFLFFLMSDTLQCNITLNSFRFPQQILDSATCLTLLS